jgi:hypothetical protein
MLKKIAIAPALGDYKKERASTECRGSGAKGVMTNPLSHQV